MIAGLVGPKSLDLGIGAWAAVASRTMSTPRAQYFYRFRLQGQLGSVCLDGPFPDQGKEKASCEVALDGYSYVGSPKDLDWCDPERDEHYAERDSRQHDKYVVGESTNPGSQLTNMARAGVESMARAGHPREEELKRFAMAVAVRAQADGLGPGEYYPRVWRPRSGFFDDLDDSVDARADASIAGRRLEALLSEIFTVLQPADQARNHGAYGHRTRELLLLACTEVENSWRAILTANHYVPPSPHGKLSTNDYVKLMGPLRLGEWSLRLADYPSTPALETFAPWTATNPTTSLPWYDAYNKTKHDRAGGFHRATLWTAVQAVAATWIMYGAQFGPQWLHEECRLLGIHRHPFDEDTAAGYITPKPQQPAHFIPKDLALP